MKQLAQTIGTASYWSMYCHRWRKDYGFIDDQGDYGLSA